MWERQSRHDLFVYMKLLAFDEAINALGLFAVLAVQ